VRVFNPKIIHRPVIVLSNNDGCVIARSNEAKAIGFKMGDAYFKVRELVERHNVAVFSSNYTLYGDMSHRVMQTLEQFAPEVEIYSIDEAFLNLAGFDMHKLVAQAGKRAKLRFHVHPHMLRHSTGYYLANRNHDTRLVQDYLGHKNIAHTVRYTRTAASRFEGLWR